MANGTVKAAAKELVSISIIAHPEYDGHTVNTDKRFGDGEHKFAIKVPAPRTDEQCQEIYGCTLDDILDAGYSQKWYGAKNVDNVIAENFARGRTYDAETKKWTITEPSLLVNPNSDKLIDKVTNAAFEQQFSAKERTSQSKEMKELKGVLSGLNMSAAQAAEYLRNMPK
jgi:hypothetical protein